MVFGLGATLATLMVLGQTETTVTFSSEPNRHPVSGFGGEWDPHFWRAPNTKRGCDEKAWETVCGRIRDIGVARVRVGILPDWYEPDNDNGDAHSSDPERFTWNTEPMRSLCRHLDFCQQNGIKVTLTWWCAPVKRQSDGKPYWLAYPGVKDWCSAPNDVEECAENVVAGLAYLIDTRGYTCIDTFTFYNEPDWSFFDNENKVDFDRYVAICRAIDARLKEAGLRNRLSLDLADASSHKGWLKQSIDSLAGIADSFNVHSYVFACDDPGLSQSHPHVDSELGRAVWRQAACHKRTWHAALQGRLQRHRPRNLRARVLHVAIRDPRTVRRHDGRTVLGALRPVLLRR